MPEFTFDLPWRPVGSPAPLGGAGSLKAKPSDSFDGPVCLRKAGFTGVLALAGLACVAPMTASATVIVDNSGGSDASGRFTVDVDGLAVFNLLTLANKGNQSAVQGIRTMDPDVEFVSDNNAESPAYVVSLKAGAAADGTSNFDTGEGDLTGANANFADGSQGYIGFEFTNAGITDYGYALVSISGDGKTTTLLRTAYDDTGAQIEIPNAVPEPETWALMVAGVGMAGGMLRHDRRRKTRVATA